MVEPQAVAKSLERLDQWIERERFLGWDPHDALNSPLLHRLTGGNRRVGQVWVQALKRAPFNLRPLLGINKGYNAKAMGLFLRTYVRRWASGDLAARAHAEWLSNWLLQNVSHPWSGACWGYNFDWPNRSFFAPAGMPTIVCSAFVAFGLLELAVLRRRLGDEAGAAEAERTVRSVAEFMLRDLNRSAEKPDELCFSYSPVDRRRVYNASLLGAQVLAELWARTGEVQLRDVASMATRYVLRRQHDDGSWWYGEDERDHWVDNFHTGYVLVSLKVIGRHLDEPGLADACSRGYRYWVDRCFDPDGAPRYTNTSRWPVDPHVSAQAILTFKTFADQDGEAMRRAWRIATWTIDHFQDPRGFFHYQQHRFYRVRIPFMRWTQAWMQVALTELLADGARP